MKKDSAFYLVFSVLLFLAGASYFPVLEYFSINTDRVLLLIQTLVSILTLLIAWTALNSWRAQNEYSNLKEVALIIFEIREIARSIKPIEDRIKEALENASDDLSCFEKPLYKAQLALFSSILKYEKCILKGMGENASKLSGYYPDKINEKFDSYFNMLKSCIFLGFKSVNKESVEQSDLVDYLDSGLLVFKRLLSNS